MKTLLLMRHAKSDWQSGQAKDEERPLNKRGKLAAPMMGERLKERKINPNRIITSSAVRALTTTQLVAEKLGYSKEDLRIQPKFYNASSQTLLNEIHRMNDKEDFIMIVGHNPGITELAQELSQQSVPAMPTCAMACLRFATKHWALLGVVEGELAFYDQPRP